LSLSAYLSPSLNNISLFALFVNPYLTSKIILFQLVEHFIKNGKYALLLFTSR
jgi:preprotein translocase subunit SecY